MMAVMVRIARQGRRDDAKTITTWGTVRHDGIVSNNAGQTTHELECGTLRLLLTTELEAIPRTINKGDDPDIQAGTTYCLQRLSASCILYLQTVHSSRSTIFFVVLAYTPQQLYLPSKTILPGRRQHGDAPSCGRRAWSDHRNPTAYGRNDAFPARPTNPCPSCTGSPCAVCVIVISTSTY